MRFLMKCVFLGTMAALIGCKSDPPAATNTSTSASARPLAAPSTSAVTSSAAPVLAPYGEADVLADIDYCSQFWLGGVHKIGSRCDFVEPSWAAGNVEAAVAKYKAGCENKDGKSCLLMIGALAHPKSPMQSKNKEAYIIDATAYLVKACEYGEPHACVLVVNRYTCVDGEQAGDGRGYICTKPIVGFLTGKKHPEFAAILEPGCKSGHGPSCTAQARHVKAIKGDVDDVTNLYKRGCELGDSQGCREARRTAKTFGFDAEVRSFEAKEFAIAERECMRIGDCNDVATAYSLYPDKPDVHKRIRELLTTACTEPPRDSLVCYTLAEMQLKGAGGPVDVTSAIPKLQARCDSKFYEDDSDLSLEPISIACRKLATIYKDGTGVEKDLNKARTLLKRACMRKDTGNSDFDAACADLDALGK